MVVLGGGAVSYERGTPLGVATRLSASGGGVEFDSTDVLGSLTALR